jgi:hypothetical protein
MMSPQKIIACRSEELAEFVGSIEVNGCPVATALKASRTEDRDQRRELITAVRGGQHVELVVRARVYRQKQGEPNRRHLRFKVDQLEPIARSFKDIPLLINHDTNDQGARKGTILTSELVTDPDGAAVFEMTFSVVKPDAVISILDGTLDRFSISWFPTGEVICTVHRTDVGGPGACACWPGDIVNVDGRPQIVEYEFQSAEGKELSGVNVPAVRGTRIEDVRAALAAERGIERRPAATAAGSNGVEPVGPAIVEPLGSAFTGLPSRSMMQAPASSPLSPELRSAAMQLGLTEDQIRQNMIDHGDLAEPQEAAAPWAKRGVSPEDNPYLAIAARETGIPLEQLRANAREFGNGADAYDTGDLEARAPEDNPCLAIAARQLGIPLEELQANAREFGNGT